MIFVAPASQPMIIGASGILKVVAGGVLPLRYQWLRNGVSIAGHTNAILTIDPVQAADAGNYTALVSNAVGSITSPAAVVTVFEALQPGMLKWKFRAKSEMQSCPAIGADGTVYIASGSENKLYALDGVTGQMKWEFLAGGWLPTSPAIGPEGTIFLASLDSRIYALNGSTGQKKWEFLTGSSVWNSPAIGADGTVYVVSDNDKVFALDGATGKKKWEYLPPSQGWSSSPMIGADGTVYLGGSDLSTSFQIYALDNATGKKKWEFPTGSSTLAIGAGGTVYINAPESGNGKICALNGATGQKEWEVPPGYSWLSAPAIGVDGTLYAGSNDKKVYALDGMTGQKKWEFSTGDGVSYAPAIGADNTVYVGSNDKKVYALDGMTGQKKWEFLTGDAVCSSPAIAVDGTVYIGSNDKCVYALVGSSRGGLANSSWPKARCDARNSGRVPEILGVRALASRVAREGSSANLSVQVVGERPLSLQWLFNGQPIVGATNTDYLISSVSTNHAGTYSVIGSNASGSVTNEPAILGVNNVVSSNFLGFLASVPSNSSLKIQSSPSILGPWSTLADATLLSGPYGFIDLSSTNAPRRFYRTQRSGGGAAQDRLELCWFPGWTLNASAGSRYRIEYVNAQTGFDNWQFLTNLSLPNGPYLFIDTAATNQWPRYYRTTPLP
jgi:outer membrane protein assembly factor BamB